MTISQNRSLSHDQSTEILNWYDFELSYFITLFPIFCCSKTVSIFLTWYLRVIVSLVGKNFDQVDPHCFYVQ